jgi:nitroreductase
MTTPTIETIHDRRSVRSFEPKAIDPKILLELIEAAAAAPSGSNSQPWRFVVVSSPEWKEKLTKLSIPLYHAWLEKMPAAFQEMRKQRDPHTNDPIYYNAAAIVFVIGSGMTADFDCPMACQNLMLAARSMGIGSCWTYIGQLVLEAPTARNLLNLFEGEKVYGPIILGYPKGGFPDAPPKKELDLTWV